MLRLVAGEGPSFRWLDAGLSKVFVEHGQEIADFADRVAGGTPAFEAVSYFALWDRWA